MTMRALPQPLAALVAALCLCLAPHASGAEGDSPAFQAMLERAEAVRSNDQAQFQALLGQMNASLDVASESQREHLQYLKAYGLAFTGRFDLGIRAAKELFDRTDDVELKFRAGALMVNGYAVTREFTEGLRYLDQILAMSDRIKDPELRQHGWSAAGAIYNQVGQYEQGKHYAELMLANDPSPRTRCFAGTTRLEALYNLGPLTSQDEAIEELVAQCTEVGELVAANFTRGQLARVWADRGDRGKAIQMLNEHIGEIEATGYPRLAGEIHSLLAELYLADGDLVMAEQHAEQAIRRSASIMYSVPLVQAYRVMYECALRRGDANAALEQHLLYAEADKAYLDNVKARELAYQLVRNETLQKSQTIELLNKQNQVLQLEQQVSAKTTQANRLLIALLAVLLATIGYWAFKTKRMQVAFRRLAETDGLTGISNRHHFTKQSESALDFCARSGEEVGLVMFDLDNFKAINDKYGHAAGDWVLKKVAEACRSVCRANDRVGRLGGEEFAFLLVGCGRAGALQLAQECRRRIAAIDTTETGHRFPVTASFGVAGTGGTGAAGYDFHALLAQADDALYRSKREGRDRVSVHSDEAPSGPIVSVK